MSRFVSNNTDRNQISLIPSSLEEMISQDNLVRVIDLFVDTLDLNQMGFRYATPKQSDVNHIIQPTCSSCISMAILTASGHHETRK
ncbi:MAG: transposase domain protein [Firmicutes bacterium]|nr:transposase domain protein [Bacillota bacterium]